MSIQGSTFQGLENIHPGKAPWPSLRSEALTTSAMPAVRNQCGKTATLNLRRDWVGQSGGKAREQTPAAVPVRRPGQREKPSLSSQSVAVTVAPPTFKSFSANIALAMLSQELDMMIATTSQANRSPPGAVPSAQSSPSCRYGIQPRTFAPSSTTHLPSWKTTLIHYSTKGDAELGYVF